MLLDKEARRLRKWATVIGLGSALLVATGCGGSQGKSSSAKAASNRPDRTAPLVEPPVPPPVTANPLKGAKLFVDPQSLAMLRANALRPTAPEKAALIDKVA